MPPNRRDDSLPHVVSRCQEASGPRPRKGGTQPDTLGARDRLVAFKGSRGPSQRDQVDLLASRSVASWRQAPLAADDAVDVTGTGADQSPDRLASASKSGASSARAYLRERSLSRSRLRPQGSGNSSNLSAEPLLAQTWSGRSITTGLSSQEPSWDPERDGGPAMALTLPVGREAGTRPALLPANSLGGESSGLTEDVFELFKRDIAVRVIQTHWRRWRAGRSQVQREGSGRATRQKHPGHSSRAAGGKLEALPHSRSGARDGRPSSSRQPARREGGAGSRDVEGDWGDGAGACPQVQPAARPLQVHKGGHAVYTFEATPYRPATPEACANSDAEPESPTTTARKARAPPAAPSPSSPAASVQGGPSSAHSAQQPPPEQPERYVVPAELRQTLDADSNPAMASPALSAITGGAGAVAGAALSPLSRRYPRSPSPESAPPQHSPQAANTAEPEAAPQPSSADSGSSWADDRRRDTLSATSPEAAGAGEHEASGLRQERRGRPQEPTDEGSGGSHASRRPSSGRVHEDWLGRQRAGPAERADGSSRGEGAHAPSRTGVSRAPSHGPDERAPCFVADQLQQPCSNQAQRSPSSARAADSEGEGTATQVSSRADEGGFGHPSSPDASSRGPSGESERHRRGEQLERPGPCHGSGEQPPPSRGEDLRRPSREGAQRRRTDHGVGASTESLGAAAMQPAAALDGHKRRGAGAQDLDLDPGDARGLRLGREEAGALALMQHTPGGEGRSPARWHSSDGAQARVSGPAPDVWRPTSAGVAGMGARQPHPPRPALLLPAPGSRGADGPSSGAPPQARPSRTSDAASTSASASLSAADTARAEKMDSIMRFLDAVEQQAEREAACAAVSALALLTEPSVATTSAYAASAPPDAASERPASRGRTHRPSQTGVGGAGGSGALGTTASRRGSAVAERPPSARALTVSQHSLGALGEAGSARRPATSGGRSTASGSGYAGRGHDLDPDGDQEEWDDEDDQEEEGERQQDYGRRRTMHDAASLCGTSTVSERRPVLLAESVYDSVRSKMRRLQEEAAAREAHIARLEHEVESLHAAARASAAESDARLTELLAAQRAEYESAVARHLAFVDRLLADKEALQARLTELEAQAKGADEKHEKVLAKLKEGWAAELRRQKEAWAAAEKQRREAWMASKASEIKDVTVKGLEGEVQKLLARHRAELTAAQQAAADEARRHLDAYVQQNEAAVRQLKERMQRETEQAVEREREAASTRLREVSERYEQQLQTQRMRLVADNDLRLEQLEQARKEERRTLEAAVVAAREAGSARQKEAEDDWAREKEAIRKAHDKQMDALREQYETGQEGWRAAISERAKKEVASRVAAIREKLLEERNEEIQAVMTRLHEEHSAALEQLKQDGRRREEEAAAAAEARLREARKAEAKMAERFRSARASAQAAEERLLAAEQLTGQLRKDVESKAATIRWLEGQVSAAKEEAAARERDLRELGADKAAVASEAAAAAEARLAKALQENAELRSRHAAEMSHVEERVKASLWRKDETIAGLREQLGALAAELRDTQHVLRQQAEDMEALGAG
ncbi:hypothetical protein HYH03_016204 [Edaphochlamys debaryana]|uniref:Centrosomal protein of 131 kDa n=1 Tax=Edaphochlamys debaryana TaxID=47281 RepID=A0A835XQ75_9CHLO|nr:hypothetical protein HYH03_016204 [Edaphochlamys debaryana]|eukprot:KAG2485000.1 hypothetical protein HYH03_016204 [Edaphochlamys debaryana]